jgi:uncharacterized membrane protein
VASELSSGAGIMAKVMLPAPPRRRGKRSGIHPASPGLSAVLAAATGEVTGGTDSIMANVVEQIDVNVPLRAAYDQWTQFEDFPRFMEGVKSVTQTDDTHLHWIAEVAGQDKEWDAEITEQHPDERVAWTSTSGARNGGVVTFHRLDDDTTRVTLQMDVDPEGVVENVGTALGFLERRVKGDLERFKEYIQGRAVPPGAWRGEVEAGSRQ